MKTPNWFLKKNLTAYLLLPLSGVYFFISKVVYFLRALRQKKSLIPVICLGNIFAGGVGKTPLVREIAKHFNAPVVMRGYKRAKRKTQNANDAATFGDEATMLKNAGIDVFVGDRVKNIDIINDLCHLPLTIVMDDGFQNPTIKKDISILVFDEKLGAGNGFILPAGPLREPMTAVRRADAVIIIRAKGSKNQKTGKVLMLAEKYKKPVFYATNKTINQVQGKIVAFAGIGYPQKFFDTFDKNLVRGVPFPDHYQYNSADLEILFEIAKSENAQLLTTEKDWVRLPADAKAKIKFAPLVTTIEPKFFNWLQGKLNEYS